MKVLEVTYTLTLKTEAADSFKMLVITYQCTQYRNPEDQNLNINVICIIGFQNMV
jgi:hypothetical protein